LSLRYQENPASPGFFMAAVFAQRPLKKSRRVLAGTLQTTQGTAAKARLVWPCLTGKTVMHEQRDSWLERL